MLRKRRIFQHSNSDRCPLHKHIDLHRQLAYLQYRFKLSDEHLMKG